MSDEKVSIDQRIATAVRDVAKALVKKGMEPAAAKELAEKHRGRLVAGETGPIHVTVPGTGTFYPVDHEEPLKALVSELYNAAPADVKFGGPTEEERLAAKQRLKERY